MISLKTEEKTLQESTEKAPKHIGTMLNVGSIFDLIDIILGCFISI
jgi:hypothetical protein